MDINEKTLLVLAFAGLTAVIVWKVSAPMRQGAAVTDALGVVTGGEPIYAAGYSQTPDPETLSQGPAYLTYNAPWAFNPALGNVMPTTSVGQIGQVSSNPPEFNNTQSDCGCLF